MKCPILGIFSLALLSSCGGSTTSTNVGPIQTAEIDLLEQYEDYSPSYSQDGSKGVFISERVDGLDGEGLAHVYVYDSTVADRKLARLDDRLHLVPTEGKEFLSSMSPSATWIGFSRLTLSTGISQVYVSHFTGTSSAKIDLEAGHSLNEISFAKGSDDYLAYVERVGVQKTLKVLKLTGDATQLTLEEIGSFDDQEKPSLLFFDGKLQLVSLSTATGVKQIVNIRNFDPSNAAWTLSSDGTLSQSLQVSERPFFVNQAGLFTTSSLATARIRKKTGSAPAIATAAAETVAVVEGINQNDIFQSALTYNWSPEAYLATEPLTVGSLSGSPDGTILLASGLDSFACVAANTQLPVQKLIRQSDSKVITWTLARKVNTVPWTDVITNPCTVVDHTIDGVARQFDGTAARSEFVGFDGDYAVISVESFFTVDRELRLVRFKIDWDAGTISDATILDVSANPRP